MKYIDADKLIAEIERRKNQTERRINNIVPIRRKDTMDEEQLAKIELRDKVDKAYLNGVLITLSDILSFITSLQQEQPVGEEYAIEIGKGVHTLRVGSQSDIDHLIHQEKQEQPKVDLEEFDKEVTKIWGRCAAEPNDSIACLHIETFNEIARHFYELGLNARKEETK